VTGEDARPTGLRKKSFFAKTKPDGALKNCWWRQHLAGAAHRLEACATKGGGRNAPPPTFSCFMGEPRAHEERLKKFENL
jgi:hypothetical protein